jgi:GeoRSP system radical SAM/SPASM protein
MSAKKKRLLKAPLIVNWSLNYSCNFSCSHCYSRNETCEELPTDKVLAAGRRLAEAGVLFANFGGGEPLLRRDLFDVTRGLTAAGLSCSMNSNGWLIDAAAAGQMADAGFASVGISMDSCDAAVHDAFRNMPGSFERLQGAAKHVRAAGVRLTLSTVVSRINWLDIEKIVLLAVDMGAACLYLHNFKCSGRGFENRAELDLDPAEWRDFYRGALELAAKEKRIEISFDDPIIASLGGASRDSESPGSSCGKLSLHIRPNGDITPCGFIPLVVGNILADDFGELWRNSEVLRAMREKEAKGKCSGCGHYADCLGGCTARAFAMTGDLNAPDPHCWAGGGEGGR